ncbi:hypothetical protein I6C35_21690 [Clostridioides difficile]|nr:hypothetical protein [Clostridioides difficile]
MSFGKRIEMNNIGVETRGVCTLMCPYTCKMMASSSCNCKNNDYNARGGSYNTYYNKLIHGQRTPDGM